MATESTHVSAVIPASPQVVYEAWLSSEQHAKMTGGAATIDPSVGGAHSAWDGYISGKTLELDPGKRIVQSWRSQQFPEEHGDSRLVVRFEEEGGHTRVTVEHTEIPEGQGPGYESGWTKHYFDPMIAYFSAAAPAAKTASRKPAAKKKAAAAKKAPPKKAAAPKKAASAKKAAKKPAAKKPAKAAKKPTAKKAAAKPAARKVAKPAPGKAAARKPAAKKPAPRKAAQKPAARGVKKSASVPPPAGG